MQLAAHFFTASLQKIKNKKNKNAQSSEEWQLIEYKNGLSNKLNSKFAAVN